MRIAVLFGGTSEERGVSIASAAQVVPALRGLGHEVFAVDTAAGRLSASEERRVLVATVSSELPSPAARAVSCGRAVVLSPAAFAVREAELVFMALHGGAGEDGRIQAMLDLAGLAYTGSNHSASAAGMDKDLSKRLFRSVDIPTPDWHLGPVNAEFIGEHFGWPVIVKPNRQGSTLGLSLVRRSQDLAAASRLARQFDTEVMIETFVPGREFTVGILDGVALPVGEIITGGEIFDYRAKYQRDGAREIFPADIGSDVSRLLQEYALRAHAVLKLGVYSRIDFRQDHSGRIWCLEVNSLPGMTATSLLPQAARVAGIDFAELLQRGCHTATDSKLVLVVLEHHAHQLAAGAHTCLPEQALQQGLDVTLGDPQPTGDSLVRQSFEHEPQHLALPLIEVRSRVRLRLEAVGVGEIAVTPVQPYPAFAYEADALGQRTERALLHENTGHALAQQTPGLGIADPRGHDEHLAAEATLPRQR